MEMNNVKEKVVQGQVGEMEGKPAEGVQLNNDGQEPVKYEEKTEEALAEKEGRGSGSNLHYIDTPNGVITNMPKYAEDIEKDAEKESENNFTEEKREEVIPDVKEMSEEEYRAMKWKYNIESGLSNLMKSILEAANVSKEEVEELDTGLKELIAMHCNENKLFLTDEELVNSFVYKELITLNVQTAVNHKVAAEGEDPKLLALKDLISDCYVNQDFFNNPDNVNMLQQRMFQKEVMANPEIQKEMTERIVKLYESDETEQQLKDAIEEEYLLIKKKYKDIPLFLSKISEGLGMLKRDRNKDKKVVKSVDRINRTFAVMAMGVKLTGEEKQKTPTVYLMNKNLEFILQAYYKLVGLDKDFQNEIDRLLVLCTLKVGKTNKNIRFNVMGYYYFITHNVKLYKELWQKQNPEKELKDISNELDGDKFTEQEDTDKLREFLESMKSFIFTFNHR
jgi:hypothetical protein